MPLGYAARRGALAAGQTSQAGCAPPPLGYARRWFWVWGAIAARLRQGKRGALRGTDFVMR